MVGPVQPWVGQKEHLTMAVHKDPDGRWRYRTVVRLPDGSKVRVSGTAPKHDNTKEAAQRAEREAINEALNPSVAVARTKKEVPTYAEWFKGRFWQEWVIGERNKPSERRSKEIIFRVHLEPDLGSLRLDEINAERVQQLRAKLVGAKKLSDKRINNVMVVLSKSLRYAMDCELIDRVPRCRVKKIERADLEAWSFDEYRRILEAAKSEGPIWYAATCLAGEAGLRIGEVRAMRWREDVDVVARAITVNTQLGNGRDEEDKSIKQMTTTPKGRTRRTIPMTSTLFDALKALDVVREGYVVRNMDGTPMSDAQTSHETYRICRKAGLPERGWHQLRHAFGTHAARFGVNPWQLMEWMGHKRIDETMGYVHVVERKPRPIPSELVAIGMKENDPTQRVLKQLAARAKKMTNFGEGQQSSETMSAG
jgi:integrase